MRSKSLNFGLKRAPKMCFRPQATAPAGSNSAEKIYTLLLAHIFKPCISDCIPYLLLSLSLEANSMPMLILPLTRNHRFLNCKYIPSLRPEGLGRWVLGSMGWGCSGLQALKSEWYLGAKAIFGYLNSPEGYEGTVQGLCGVQGSGMVFRV